MTFTVVAKSFWTPRVFPLNPVVNKPCKIKRCGDKMHQIVHNMILGRGLEHKLWNENYLRSAPFTVEMGLQSKECENLFSN